MAASKAPPRAKTQRRRLGRAEPAASAQEELARTEALGPRDDLRGGAGNEGAADDGKGLVTGRFFRLGSRAAVGILAVSIVLLAQARSGTGAAILVLAGYALLSVIAIFWASIRTFFGEVPLSGADAYALGAPRAEEEQKRAVLRALKDLEFERSVGKISEEDYRELVARYRAEAKRLLRAIEEASGPERARALERAAERLEREGLTLAVARYRQELGEPEGEVEGRAEDGQGPRKKRMPFVSEPELEDVRRTIQSSQSVRPPAVASTPPLRRQKLASLPGAEPKACASCGTDNDPDAVFCKRCGARQSLAPAPAPKFSEAELGAEAPDGKKGGEAAGLADDAGDAEERAAEGGAGEERVEKEDRASGAGERGSA